MKQFEMSIQAEDLSVAPFAGAWIETLERTDKMSIQHVAPFAGAWIETSLLYRSEVFPRSLPSRERGLKLFTDIVEILYARRSLRGSVD